MRPAAGARRIKTYTGFANLYDLLMDDVDYGAWYAYYRALLARANIPVKSCVDLCCGTGQFGLRLAADGMAVTGVDLSEDMLRVASQNARAAGRAVQLVKQDMRALELPRPVGAVLCACDGVNYLIKPEDVRTCFERVFDALMPGGVFAFDISTRYKLKHVLGDNATCEDRGKAAYLWRNAYDDAAHIGTMFLTFFERREDGLYRRFCEVHQQRGHTAEELRAWLEGAGFADIDIYGGRTLAPPGPKDTRIHVVAVRP